MSLVNAFGVSEEDVKVAVKTHLGRDIDLDLAETLLSRIDTEAVASSALDAIDLDDQTTIAQAEIARQLRLLCASEPGLLASQPHRVSP